MVGGDPLCLWCYARARGAGMLPVQVSAWPTDESLLPKPFRAGRPLHNTFYTFIFSFSSGQKMICRDPDSPF